MKKFILHWKDGKKEEVTGNDITSAFNNAGYSQGAIRVLDYYEEVKS
jgi:hypothetical protein